jgi:hypothetical protein
MRNFPSGTPACSRATRSERYLPACSRATRSERPSGTCRRLAPALLAPALLDPASERCSGLLPRYSLRASERYLPACSRATRSERPSGTCRLAPALLAPALLDPASERCSGLLPRYSLRRPSGTCRRLAPALLAPASERCSGLLPRLAPSVRASERYLLRAKFISYTKIKLHFLRIDVSLRNASLHSLE